MGPGLWLILILVSLLIVFVFLRFVFRQRHRQEYSVSGKKQDDHASEQGFSFKILNFTEPVAFSEQQPVTATQSPEWLSYMQETGCLFERLKISQLVFVHGTFVGDDPFDILRFLRKLHPRLAHLLHHSIRRNKERVFYDNGYFTESYAELAQLALGPAVRCRRFSWSSGNHHLARLEGAFDLIMDLAAHHEDDPYSRRTGLLLVGHSHAGQLFAILTALLNQRGFADEMFRLYRESGGASDPEAIRNSLKNLKNVRLYLVTMGTPPRYRWCLSHNIRLLHLINHRKPDAKTGSSSGVLTTRDGDYIQQWGVAGSDSPSPLRLHQQINRKLDAWLDMGCHPLYWKQQLRHQKRLHDKGFHFLIDYGDCSKVPNCLATIFGHGVYTRQRMMLYNLRVIAEYFSGVSDLSASLDNSGKHSSQKF
ncbi:MAG: hypothetical protein H6618_06110 [Deltaproteobacteria bacterium]|nr:hypothetical protein [Deltaproteobacteria bacterium]